MPGSNISTKSMLTNNQMIDLVPTCYWTHISNPNYLSMTTIVISFHYQFMKIGNGNHYPYESDTITLSYLVCVLYMYVLMGDSQMPGTMVGCRIFCHINRIHFKEMMLTNLSDAYYNPCIFGVFVRCCIVTFTIKMHAPAEYMTQYIRRGVVYFITSCVRDKKIQTVGHNFSHVIGKTQNYIYWKKSTWVFGRINTIWDVEVRQ